MNQNNKIILIGTTAASVYGFRADLIKKLLSESWNVYAFICEYNDEDLIKIQKLGAIPITYTMNRGGLNPIADLCSIYDLKKKIQEIQPEIVFSYFAKPVIYGTIAASLAKVPKLIGMLEGLGYSFTDQLEKKSFKAKLIQKIQIFLYKLSLPKLNQMVFLNPDDEHDLLIKNNIKISSINILGGIGVNLKQYKYSQVLNSEVSFLFIGRLLKEKGIFDFINAIRIVKKRYPDAKFTVLGEIDAKNPGALSKDDLNKMLDNKLFEYPGYVNNPIEWIQKSSVFVLPSYREGVPRSTQEAMAIGRPVITTDVPGCRETVEDGVNGFLIPKWNTEALAEKMIYFIENPEQVNIMGKASHEIAVKKFDADKVNQRLFEIIGITES